MTIPHCSVDRQALLEQRMRCCLIAVLESQLSQEPVRATDEILVAYLSGERQKLLRQGLCLYGLRLVHGHIRQSLERPGNARLVPRLPRERQSLTVAGRSHWVVASL